MLLLLFPLRFDLRKNKETMLYFCYLKITIDSQEKQQQKRSKLDPFYLAFLSIKKKQQKTKHRKQQMETPPRSGYLPTLKHEPVCLKNKGNFSQD